MVVELPRDPQTGKRRQKWVTVTGTKKDAERILAELITEVEHNHYGTASSKLTVSQYLAMWLEAVKPRLRQQTYEIWQANLRYWDRVLGAVPIAKLTALDIQRAVNEMPGHYRNTTKRNVYDPFRVAMKQAVRWGLLARSPTDGVVIPAPSFKSMTVWNEGQVGTFLEAAKKSRYFALFHTALATGMRLGELLGLTWDDVDLKEGTVHVRRSLTLHRVRTWQDPKTPRSQRKVPIDLMTVEVLRQWRKRQLQERLRAGPGWNEHNLVFTTRRGRPLYKSAVLKALKVIAERAGVPPIRFHDLRHTHATLLLRQGVHPKVVAERLGHAHVSLTLEIYSHVLPDTQREAVKAVERVWNHHPVSKRLASPE
ncbi:MAG: tyrosine-type recombinase/integrase [Bacillota bacterium]